MNEVILGALIGVGGSIIGTLLSLLINFFIEKYKLKKEKINITLQLKIDTYADAIRYISIYVRLKNAHNIEEKRVLASLEGELYNKFHPIFTIIAKKDIVEQYNNLRNRIEKENIKLEDAYAEVVKVLNFNLNKKDGK